MADFSLRAVFGLDATGVRTELKQLTRETRDFANTWGSIGFAAAGAAFVALAKGAVDLASQLKNSATALGINIEALQTLNYVATQNGSSQEQMGKALEKTRVFLQKATEGGEAQVEVLRKLGLSADKLAAMPLERKFEAIAKAYANAGDKGAAYNAVSEIFGEKVGPKMIAALGSLASTGFPGAAEAAQKAGHIMSQETVLALEQASQAIEDFKKRATIAVGNIIVNFRTEEGVTLLLYQLRAVGEKFVARIADAVVEAGGLFKATFEAVGVYARERVQNGLVSAVEAMAKALNSVLPEKFEINIGNLEKFRVASEDFGDIINRTISETKPSGFTEAVEKSWDKIISDQKKVVDALNKKDFGKEAAAIGTSIDNAGTSLTSKVDKALKDFFGDLDAKPAPKPFIEAAEAIEAAGEYAGEQLHEAGEAVHARFADLFASIERTGTNYADQSTASLEGVISRLNAQLQAINYADSQQGASVGGKFRSPEAYLLQSELYNAQRELAQRRAVLGYAQQFGEDAARRQYGDTATDKALRDMQESTTRTAVATESLNANLRAINKKLGIPGV